MAPNQRLVERVMAFVAHETAFPARKLSLDTRLSFDIGLAGDDAIEFFEAFVLEFGVDPGSLQDLDFDEHFGDERPAHPLVVLGGGLLLLAGCIRPLRPLTQAVRHRWLEKEPPGGAVRVQDLVSAAAAGRWLKQPATP